MAMKTGMRLDISEVLERCLFEIKQGKTIQDCITTYSGYPELGALLQTAALLQTVERPTMPFGQAQMLEQRLLDKFQALSIPTPPPHRQRVRDWTIVVRPFVAACAALMLVFVAAGIIDASSSALPGDNLYGLKRTVEQIDLQLSSTQEARDQVYDHMAEQRLFEGTLLVLQSKPLDAAFISDTNATVSAVLGDKLLPAVQAQLATRAGYLLQLIKQQNAQAPDIRQLATMLDRLAVS